MVFSVIFLVALLLVTQLFVIQVFQKDYYSRLAEKQYDKGFGNNFSRGSIFFTQKDGKLISAAGIRQGYLLAIKPTAVTDAEAEYNRLSKILTLDKANFSARALKKDDPYEEITHFIPEAKALAVRALKLPGVSLYKESWRYYPGGNLASKVLGFVGLRGETLSGLYGVEKSQDKVLYKSDRGPADTNSFFQIFLEAKNKFFSGDSKGDVVLTIEPQAQSFLEKQVAGVLEKYSAATAGGIIIEPKTGKILAMAGKPDFNPNKFGEERDLSVFLNPNVQSVFEMGSIIKAVTMASAIDSGAVTPKTEYVDEGSVTVDGRTFSNFDGKARGRVTMQDVLNNSLNTGAYFAMKTMGKEVFRTYFQNFGFGEKTKIDLPDELAGITRNLKSPRTIEYATASFGQGIALTPVQTSVALSALANGGLIMKPYVVDRLEFSGFPDKVTAPQEIRRVIKPETSRIITQMLVAVVDKALLGGTAKLEHYSVAAKTGTAQIKSESGGYEANQYFHTFFGYAPASAPKFLVFLYVEKPQGVDYASHTLTASFFNTIKFLLNYYEVPPDR